MALASSLYMVLGEGQELDARSQRPEARLSRGENSFAFMGHAK